MKAEDVAAEFERLAADCTMEAFAERRLVKARATRALIAERDALLGERQRFEARLFDMARHMEQLRAALDRGIYEVVDLAAHDCAERDDLQEQRRALLDEVVRLRRVEELYKAGTATWRPVYKHLLDERNALRSALAGLLRHPGIADMAPEDKDPEDHALERAARAALDRKP